MNKKKNKQIVMNKSLELKFSFMVFLCLMPIFGNSANNKTKHYVLKDGDISIVSSGTGASESEATTDAIRNALEQAFGTFVSSNTTLVNDDLVKDEIVSITTGNVRNYELLNTTMLPNGNTTTLVKAVVSTNNLVTYAQNHGSSTELAGNRLAQDMRMEQMNIKNECITMSNLISQLWSFVPGLFDYEIELDEPQMLSTQTANIPFRINVKSNNNSLSFQNLLRSTIAAIPNASGKIQGMGSIKYFFCGVEKKLNSRTWKRDFLALCENGIIPQLTAFDIVDQDNNIIGGIDITKKQRFTIPIWSDRIPLTFDDDKFIFSSRGKVTLYDDSLRFRFERIKREGSYWEGYFYLGPNAVPYKDNKIIPAITLNLKKYEYYHPLPGYYGGSYYHRDGDSFSGEVFFTFPFITAGDKNIGAKVKKKYKNSSDESESEILFVIDGLNMQFNVNELNRISEIHVIPKKIKSPDFYIAPSGNFDELFVYLLSKLRIDTSSIDSIENTYGILIRSDNTVPGTDVKLTDDIFQPFKFNRAPLDTYIYKTPESDILRITFKKPKGVQIINE